MNFKYKEWWNTTSPICQSVQQKRFVAFQTYIRFDSNLFDKRRNFFLANKYSVTSTSTNSTRLSYTMAKCKALMGSALKGLRVISDKLVLASCLVDFPSPFIINFHFSRPVYSLGTSQTFHVIHDTISLDLSLACPSSIVPSVRPGCRTPDSISVILTFITSKPSQSTRPDHQAD